MQHPLFGSRCWTLDPNVTTRMGHRLQRIIPDRPDLLQNLEEIRNWYQAANRFHSLEAEKVREAISSIDAGLPVRDDTASAVEAVAKFGPPVPLEESIFEVIRELHEASCDDDIPLGLVGELRNLVRTLSSYGLVAGIEEVSEPLWGCVEMARTAVANIKAQGPWFPNDEEAEELQTILLLVNAQGVVAPTHITDYGRAKSELKVWFNDRLNGVRSPFPRRFVELLRATFRAPLKELMKPTFKPGDVAVRRRMSWWDARSKNKDAVLMVVSGPAIKKDKTQQFAVSYTCFEPGVGDIEVPYDSIKRPRAKKNSKSVRTNSKPSA